MGPGRATYEASGALRFSWLLEVAGFVANGSGVGSWVLVGTAVGMQVVAKAEEGGQLRFCGFALEPKAALVGTFEIGRHSVAPVR